MFSDQYMTNNMHCVLLLSLLLVSLSHLAAAATNVTSLPGYGTIPFTLETGYVGVGELDEVQLFYYFVPSQRNPVQDPVLLWLTGGPGCSCLSAFFYESGPVVFNFDGYRGGLPTLSLNPNTWTKTLNIIYVDAPVGTGFSYSTSATGYPTNDYKASYQTYQFLRKWLLAHPQYLDNNLYIGGDSYSGIPVPMIVQLAYDGNMAGKTPYLNLKGYVLGNPKTDDFWDNNERVPVAHRLTLISDEIYEYAKGNCSGNYIYVNDTNVDCYLNLQTIEELLEDINLVHVLEPRCGVSSREPDNRDAQQLRRSLEQNAHNHLSTTNGSAFNCRDYTYNLVGAWANDEDVRTALGVREGTKGDWSRCNGTLAYSQVVTSSIAYHQNLSTTSLRALVYSGDHDMSIPHLATQGWIRLLNMTLSDSWRAWKVDGQVAGYTKRYITDSLYALTFATVKGAGHVAPEYKPKEVYEMLNRWFGYYPL